MGVQNNLPLSPKGKICRRIYADCVFLEALADWLATCADFSAQSHGGTKAGAVPDRRTQCEPGSSPSPSALLALKCKRDLGIDVKTKTVTHNK